MPVQLEDVENGAKRHFLPWAALEGTDLGSLNLALFSVPSWTLEKTTDGHVL